VSARDRSCKSCKKAVIWGILETNGHFMPLDPEPARHGNVAVTETLEGRYCRVLKDGEGPLAGEILYVSHFSSCPDAASHRRHRKRQDDPQLAFDINGVL
jgi:hypothetical protein